MSRENLRPTIEIIPEPPLKTVAEQKFHFWKRTALRFVVGGNASGLIISLGLVHFSPAVIPGFFVFAFAFFSLGLFCAGATIFSSWRHSAAYVTEEADTGLLTAIPQRIGDWFESRSGWLVIVSLLLFCLGVLTTLISMLADL